MKLERVRDAEAEVDGEEAAVEEPGEQCQHGDAVHHQAPDGHQKPEVAAFDTFQEKVSLKSSWRLVNPAFLLRFALL